MILSRPAANVESPNKIKLILSVQPIGEVKNRCRKNSLTFI